MALVVSPVDDGLQIFPTHRVFTGRPDLASSAARGAARRLEDALAEHSRSRAIVSGGRRIDGVPSSCSTARASSTSAWSSPRPRGHCYTPDSRRPWHAVDRGEAEVAVADARDPYRGRLRGRQARRAMPQKSTYFFPKLLSGLLIHPLEPMTPWLETCRLCVADIRARARRAAGAGRARARATAGRGRRRDDRDRRGCRGRHRRAARARSARTSCWSPRSWGTVFGREADRRRRGSHRRLDEREARDPVLLVLARHRGRPHG